MRPRQERDTVPPPHGPEVLSEHPIDLPLPPQFFSILF